MDLDAHGTLLLNADYRPLSVRPLSTVSYKDAIRGLARGEMDFVADSGHVARSPSVTVPLPSVVALKRYVDLDRPATLTRWNLFLAYDLRCCLCAGRFSTRDLTFDHLLPRSRGGSSTWANLVPACVPCNGAKADRTPEEAGLRLWKRPYRPTLAVLNAAAARLAPPASREEWADWLYWNVAVER